MATEQRMRPRKRKKVCAFCVDKVTAIDYKDTAKQHRYRWYGGAESCHARTGNGAA